MPNVISNEDGTRTLTVNSGELRVLANLLTDGIPDVSKVIKIVDSPDTRAIMSFVKAVVAP